MTARTDRADRLPDRAEPSRSDGGPWNAGPMTAATCLAEQFLDALEERRSRAEARREAAAGAVREEAPVARHPFVGLALAALDGRIAELVESGEPDPLCTTALLDPPSSFIAGAATMLRTAIPGGLNDPPAPTRLGCLLLAGGLLSVEDLARGAELVDEVPAGSFGRAIVLRHVVLGDLAAAEEAADHPRLSRRPYAGWRVIGTHHALQGDDAAFLARWAKYRTTEEKTWIDETRRTLVEEISRIQGWKAGLAATRRPRISTPGSRAMLVRSALGPLADTTREPALRELFATAPELAEVDELAQLAARVRSVLAHREKRATHTDHPDLRPLLDEIIALDPTASRDVMRARDGMLFRLWETIGDATTLAQTRRAMRTPAFTRQMMSLADDIEPPTP